MARLRKPISPENSFTELPSSAQRACRSSPRKTVPESTPARQLRYTWQEKTEDSFLVPKIPASLALNDSPKKQRVLRPVASNSRLLRKLSNESLATPDRKERLRPAKSNTGLSYARSLARTVAKSKGDLGRFQQEKKIEHQFEETVLDENEDLDESLWCGDEEDDTREKEQEEEEVAVSEVEQDIENEGEKVDEDEDEDDDDIVDVRNRRTQTRRRIVESDSESESEDEDIPTTKVRNMRLENPDSESESDSEQADELPTKNSAPQNTNNSISNWAQDVVDLTSSPDAPSSFAVPSQTRMRTSSFASVTRPTSSYSIDGPGVVQ